MHALWKGAISFGLVHIPIRVYSASATRELKFKLLHKKDLSEIRYARICKTDGKEVPWDEIVKGYEYEEGNYVVLSEEDFKKANPQKTKTIEILDFTDEDQVDTIFYDTPYYLEPEKNAENAYFLLVEALKKTKKIAIGRFVFHNHEHIGAIRIYNNILMLHQFRYYHEIKSAPELQSNKKALSKTEIDLAIHLIDKLSKPFNPENYADSYIEDIKEVIEKKAKGEKVKVKKAPSRKVEDILSLLQKSLEQPKKKKRANVAEPKKRKRA